MLALSFFFVAMLYSIVGFGGGTSYLALLAVSNINYSLIPKLALICNLLVVSGNSYHFYKGKHFNLKLMTPLLFSSIPMAFLGGIFKIQERHFLILLSTCLVVAAVRLLIIPSINVKKAILPNMPQALAVGCLLGFLSGLVGIGGGIFLAPLMLNMSWGKPKEVASTASAFIFLNSLSGLAGQFTKGISVDLIGYWPLFLVVIVGGQIGAFMGSHSKVSQLFIKRLTAILIISVATRLLIKLLT